MKSIALAIVFLAASIEYTAMAHKYGVEQDWPGRAVHAGIYSAVFVCFLISLAL